MALLSVYFLILLFIKLKHYNNLGTRSLIFYQGLVMATYVLNFTDGTVNQSGGEFKKDEAFHLYIIVTSITVGASYFVLLTYLRIYGQFAVYINIIYYSLKDTIVYNIILTIGAVAFTNAMYILAMLEKPDTDYDKVTGPNLFTGVLMQVKGYLYTEKPGQPLKNKYVFGIFFILYTLLITSTMMKVLINILHAIFEKATHVYENERLKTKCSLILSNESIFGR